MAIEFRCPQGHRLSCPEERAGKIGKCPKCGSTFVVPSAEIAASVSTAGAPDAAMATSESGSLSVGPNSDAPTSGGNGAADAAGSAPLGDVIVFLCPNGHKLNCPPSLQGKAGKCPHCGARFVIPQSDDAPPEDYLSDDETLHEDDLEEMDEGDDSHVDEEEVLEAGDHDHAAAALPGAAELPADFLERLSGSGLSAATPAPQPLASAAPPPSPLVEAFMELWQHRARGLAVQLHLRSGTVLAPDRYSFEASDDRCAIFAVKEADGTFAVSAVAWDEVERISVQGLKFLPDELFQ